jgi:hypothetical protein
MNELPNQIAARLKSGSRRTAFRKVEPFDTGSLREENGG